MGRHSSKHSRMVERPDDLRANDDKVSTSVIWKFFHVSKKQPSYAWCIIPHCRSPCVARPNSGTTGLHRHMRTRHPTIPVSNDVQGREESVRKYLQDHMKPGYSKAQIEKLDRMMTQFIISSCSAFTITENVDWLNWIAELTEHRYVPMGRTKLVDYVDSMYQEMMLVLINDMKQHCVSITTDGASLQNGESYMAVTAHYITDEWVMRDIVLAVVEMEGSHTGEYVDDLLSRVLSEWECSTRVFGAITDNGANFVKATRVSEEVKEALRCTVHTLQLALKDAWKQVKPIDDLFTDVRTAVTRIRASNGLKEELQQAQFRSMQEELVSHAYALVTDVSTRFNSMCMVLERFLKLKDAVQVCLSSVDVAISPSQWASMKEYLQTLSLVKEVSDQLETSLSPSLGLSVASVCCLNQNLSDEYKNMNIQSCRDFCHLTRDSIYARLVGQLSCKASALSLMLDPRVRTKIIPGYDSEDAAMVLRREWLHFDYSKYIDKPQSPPTSASSSSSSSSSSAIEVEKDSAPRSKRQRTELEDRPIPEASEIDRYLSTPGIKLSECPLSWWKTHASSFPTLANMARVYLSVPASSAPSERVFSVGTLVLDPKRRRLSPDRVARLMFMKYNMKLYRELSNK